MFRVLLAIILFQFSAQAQVMGSVRKDVFGFQSGGRGDIFHPYAHGLRNQKSSLKKTFGRSKGRGTLQFQDKLTNKIYGTRHNRFKGNAFSSRGHFKGMPNTWISQKKAKSPPSQNNYFLTDQDLIRAQPNFASEQFERF